MTALDPRSLTFMALLMGALMGLVLLGLRRSYPPSILGLLPWSLAPLLCAAAAGVYGLDGMAPPALVAQGGNALLLAGCGLFYVGSQRFYGLPPTWRFWAGLGLACLAALSWFLWARPDYRIRVMLFTGTMALLVLAHLRLLLRHGRGFAPRFTAAVLALQALVLLARGAAAPWVDAVESNRFAPTAIQTAYIAAYSFSVLLISIGLLLTASERLRAEFEQIASRDALTGALTRRALLEAGEREMERWLRYGRPLSLLLLDIDHFKQINDRYGHLVGDRVLGEFVALLERTLRHADRLGRFGGEEFIVLLPETEAATARVTAERIRQAVAQQAPAAGLPGCTTSIGLASCRPGDSSLDAMLARADAALYRAKAQGRNRVEIEAGAE
ncbi:MAG TPA: GGDEF domain-containing protein, partial [Roseateles sp.]|nr:GGDEF domain-containing protein [Roseateles sp.]